MNDPSLADWGPPIVFLIVAGVAGLGLGILFTRMRER